MRYEWIIFDADGTLFDYNAAERYALTNTFAEFSMDISGDILKSYRAINEPLFRQFENGDISMSELRTKKFSLLFKEIKIKLNIDTFSDRYLEHLSSGSQLLPDTEGIVRQLYNKSNLIILTNGIAGVQRPRFEHSQISKYFEDIIISEEEGYAKPSREIFNITFKRMGFPELEQVLMVGDSLRSDIAGGNNYGIDTCWIKHNSGSIKKSTATFTISKLNELYDILKIG